MKKTLNFNNRRYIGSKRLLVDKIFSLLDINSNNKFVDLFAGTAVVAEKASRQNFKKVAINDFLYHNFCIYNAFFSNKEFSIKKIEKTIDLFNNFKFKNSLFVEKYGGKYFNKRSASKIWEGRKYIEKNKNKFTEREYFYLITVIILAADKYSKTVGHFESFLRSGEFKDIIFLPLNVEKYSSDFSFYNSDANKLVKENDGFPDFDVVYIDPPYNSRQYAFFYHILETISLFKLDNNTIGIANKPKWIYEKSSEYSKSKAHIIFKDLISNIKSKYIVVSYNNTFSPKSSSSKNKINLNELENILKTKGNVKKVEIPHKYFNAGKTSFDNHAELLFIVKVKND